jgi:hypothetical protein
LSALTILVLPVLLFFGGLTVLFDVLITDAFRDQVAAAGFAQTTATMTQAEVVAVSSPSGGGRSGRSYDLRVGYTYEVNGKTYTGDQYSFVTGDTWTTGDKERVAASLRPPREVPVYYDPDDPERAVLTNQLFAGDWFVILLLTPFNVAVLGMVWFVFNSLWIDLFRPAFGGAAVRRTQRDVRVNLSRMTPIGSAMLALFVSSFAMVFVLGFGALPIWPSPIVVFAGLGACVLLAAGVWVRRRLRIGSGALDLIIDRERGRLTLPVNYRRDESLVVSTADVARIGVREELFRKSKGGGKRGRAGKGGRTAHVVRVEMTDGRVHRIAERIMEERAVALASDIATFAGVAGPGPREAGDDEIGGAVAFAD